MKDLPPSRVPAGLRVLEFPPVLSSGFHQDLVPAEFSHLGAAGGWRDPSMSRCHLHARVLAAAGSSTDDEDPPADPHDPAAASQVSRMIQYIVLF